MAVGESPAGWFNEMVGFRLHHLGALPGGPPSPSSLRYTAVSTRPSRGLPRARVQRASLLSARSAARTSVSAEGHKGVAHTTISREGRLRTSTLKGCLSLPASLPGRALLLQLPSARLCRSSRWIGHSAPPPTNLSLRLGTKPELQRWRVSLSCPPSLLSGVL